jgi:3-methyladenine DNA glycosylase AlkD
VCDACACNLFDRTRFARRTAVAWSKRDEEFVKRCGFAMMAGLAVHDKTAPDAAFAPFLRRIEEEAGDERKYVKKAANWALRQIGKRDPALRRAAVATARRIARQGTPSARWIASDALRELLKDASR